MSEIDVDLDVMAAQLKKRAEQLAARAERDVEVPQPELRPALDPDFADNLRKSLAAPRQRLHDIARSAG
jgi:hypothetical protein